MDIYILALFQELWIEGEAYLNWAGKLWKPDTLFAAVIKLRDLYFLILPWLLWEWRSNRVVILIFGVLTTTSLALSLSLGGRGLILYPVLLLLGGLWLAQAPVRPLRWLITALLATSSRVGGKSYGTPTLEYHKGII